MIGAALVLAIAFIGIIEFRLAFRGFHPAATDSKWSWIVQRERASSLGSHALVLVGASRMLLDVDPDVLRRRTGLEPVQLAIDGSSFIPVLRNLADDPRIRGFVLVNYQDNVIATHEGRQTSDAFVAEWQQTRPTLGVPNFSRIEDALTDRVRGHLRSYADGARPLTSIRKRLLASDPEHQYLRVLPDRSWIADFAAVSGPGVYYGHVVRTLGQPLPMESGMTWRQLDTELRRRIDTMSAADDAEVADSAREVRSMVARIEARGGKVAFAKFPTSGLIRTIDEKRYPRDRFWTPFTSAIGADAIDARDDPVLRAFRCPDGSHLDFHDRAAFTNALVNALGGVLQAVPERGS